MALTWVWLLRPVFLFSITFPGTLSMPESEALLKLKSSFTNSRALDSWIPSTAPCREGEEQWSGVVCLRGFVKGLYVGSMGLSGKIDVNALTELRGLRTLSFVNNSFSGKIPKFNRLGGLRALYLSRNQFSGHIPPGYFDGMHALRKLWLSDNNFTGRLPLSVFKLHHLKELHLEENQFNGTIPSLDQPTLVGMNLSNNKLEGEVPASLSRFNASSFSGNAGLCGKNVGVECRKVPAAKASAANNNIRLPSAPRPHPSRSPPVSEPEKDDTVKIIAAGTTLSVMLLSILIVIIVRIRRNSKIFNMLEKQSIEAVEVQGAASGRREVEMNRSRRVSSSRRRSANLAMSSGIGELVLVNDKKGVFGLPELMKAAAEVLGNGGLGPSYKTMMAGGVTVVVKRMKDTNSVRRDGFDSEVRRLGMLSHANVLTPLAYHYRKDEKLLVYEYIPGGSLLYLLHGDQGASYNEFTWPARLKIVQGIARGVGYLHTELADLDLPHGNLKSSNVLISNENEALISEFGFCTFISQANLAEALFAYKAPEAIQSGKVTPKCDVFCLGVIILEILTGKFPSQYLSNGEGGIDIVEWLESALPGGRVTDLLDPEIACSANSLGEMKQLLEIGRACTRSAPEQRLEMSDAVRRVVEIHSKGNKDGYADNQSQASWRSFESALDNFDHKLSWR